MKTVLSILFLSFLTAVTLTEEPFYVPENWPEPTYDFQKNPLEKEKISLGRHLFYDPVLSRDSSISCSSCHLQYSGFTHVDHDLSHGIDGIIGTRNSPTLMNLAWATSFMWDGSVNHLDMQGLAPISNPVEMDEEIGNVVQKLQRMEKYRRLFQAAYGDSIVTGEHLLKALSQFQLTFVSANSKYDKVMRKEEGISFTEQEAKGYAVFQKNCASCHQEPLFTNHQFENNGLPVDSTLMDAGRSKISLNEADYLKFKVPTLRNIEFSYPYMHDGRFAKLSQVLRHYAENVQETPSLAKQLKGGISLSPAERVDIMAFLLTLTDKEFLFNTQFSFPRE